MFRIVLVIAFLFGWWLGGILFAVGFSGQRPETSTRGGEYPPLSLKLDKNICQQECTVFLTITYGDVIRVGQQVCVSVDDGEIYSRSCWNYGGGRVSQTRIHFIPANNYFIHVDVSNYRDTQSLMVLP